MVSEEWREDARRGIELSVAESHALWDFLQRSDCPPYWEEREIASVANKAKSFAKYGPWSDDE